MTDGAWPAWWFDYCTALGDFEAWDAQWWVIVSHQDGANELWWTLWRLRDAVSILGDALAAIAPADNKTVAAQAILGLAEQLRDIGGHT